MYLRRLIVDYTCPAIDLADAVVVAIFADMNSLLDLSRIHARLDLSVTNVSFPLRETLALAYRSRLVPRMRVGTCLPLEFPLVIVVPIAVLLSSLSCA